MIFSQNGYVLIDFNRNICPNRSGMLPEHSQTLLGHFWEKHLFTKNDDFYRPALFAKVDLIWRIRPIRMRQNAHILMPILSCVHPTLLKT